MSSQSWVKKHIINYNFRHFPIEKKYLYQYKVMFALWCRQQLHYLLTVSRLFKFWQFSNRQNLKTPGCTVNILPMHVKPSVSSVNPAEQVQVKEPALLLQVYKQPAAVSPPQLHWWEPIAHSSVSKSPQTNREQPKKGWHHHFLILCEKQLEHPLLGLLQKKSWFILNLFPINCILITTA